MNIYLKLIIFSLFFIFLLLLFLIFWSVKNEKTIHQILCPEYYSDKFPEHLFLPCSNERNYYSRVDKGYQNMKNSSVAILGMAYNLGEEKTHKLMKRLTYLCKKWKDYRIFLYAYDSTDDTFLILNSYAKFNKKIILPKVEIDKTGLNRIEKMSKLRNLLRKSCIEYCNSNNNFNPNYVMFQDCDLASSISIDGIANSISYLNDQKYDAMFANGVSNEFIINLHIPFLGYYYYDSFAFLEDKNNKLIGGNKAFTYGRGDKPFSVKSAFGGCAIYRYKLFKKYSYNEKNKYQCEHISLNKQIYNDGYKLAINPSMILIAGRQGENFHKGKEKKKFGKLGYKELTLSEEELSYNIF